MANNKEKFKIEVFLSENSTSNKFIPARLNTEIMEKNMRANPINFMINMIEIEKENPANFSLNSIKVFDVVFFDQFLFRIF